MKFRIRHAAAGAHLGLATMLSLIIACGPARVWAASSDRPAHLASISGWWLAKQPFLQARLLNGDLPPMKPAAAAQLRAAIGKMNSGSASDYCRPMKFAGYNYGVAAELEVLLGPGRATLISDDVGMVRRIYIGPRMPAAPPVTNSGTSTARWDGDVLVIETTGLDPGAPFPILLPGAPGIGADAKVTERLSLADPDTLVIETETIAPEILTGPYRQRSIYRRVRQDMDYATPICTDHDRSVDRATGRQRFDSTPPPDLPPPPSD